MRAESGFRTILWLCAAAIVLLLAGIAATLFLESLPSIKTFGLGMLTGTEWNPISRRFGALPFVVGTLLTSFVALLISIPFSLCIALLTGNFFRDGFFPGLFNTLTELLAGVPSVIYGFWGLFVLVPLIRDVEMKLHVLPYGVGIFTAALVLSIMVVPYAASISREVIRLVPAEMREAAYSLGATRLEVVKRIILPYSFSGIMAGVLLALGRALGETMAVTMVIGNANFIPKSIFAPGNTMASVIANEFTEATEALHVSSLIEIGLLLFVMTLLFNLVGTSIVRKMKMSG